MTGMGRAAARPLARKAQADRDWTNGVLAEAAGVDRATIGDFMSGKRWPRKATLESIESALELTLALSRKLEKTWPARG